MKLKTTNSAIIRAINEYFTFSRMHRRGSLLLLMVMILLLSGFYMVIFFKTENTFDASDFKLEIKQFEANLKNGEQYKYAEKMQYENHNKSEKYYETKKDQVKFFSFNPNQADLNDFKKLGLSEKQTQVILRYRTKGGVFRNKTDLKKMYCLSAEEYHKLEPFIHIPEDTTEQYSYKKDITFLKTKNIYPEEIYNLNTVNAENLDSIKGIGPATASAIVKYREKLGGFFKIEQLKEVYGIDSLLYEKIKLQFTVETTSVNKININNGFADDLKHPYLDKSLARLIVNYRKFHGPFNQVEDLHKLALVNEELYSKLAPYLCTK